MSPILQQLIAQLMEWQGVLQSYGWLGLGAFAFALVVLQMALIPLSIFAIAGGAIFGFWNAFWAVTVGVNLGAVVNFLLARYVARGAVSRYLSHHEKFRLIDDAIGREGGKIVALLRFCPLPFGLSNYCYGLTSVRLQPYVLATVLATIPGNMFFIWLGASAQEGLAAFTGAGRARHPGEYVLLGVGLVAAFCALGYVTRVARAAVEKGGRAPDVAPIARSKAA